MKPVKNRNVKKLKKMASGVRCKLVTKADIVTITIS